ncbi:MAG: DNA repair protein RecO [Vulcanimicrobiota bacterium]
MSRRPAVTEEILLLRRRPFRDRSDLVDGLSRTSGRVAGVIHRSRSFVPDPPILVQASRRSGPSLDTFSQPLVLNAYPGLRSSLEAMLVAGFLGRLFLGSLPEAEPNEGAFELLSGIYQALARQADPRACGLWGQSRLLELLGLAPQIEVCVLCGSSDLVAFSALEGGVLCGACFSDNGFRLPEGELGLLRRLRLDSWQEVLMGGLPPGEVRTAGRVFKSQLQVHLGLSDDYFKRVLPKREGQV